MVLLQRTPYMKQFVFRTGSDHIQRQFKGAKISLSSKLGQFRDNSKQIYWMTCNSLNIDSISNIFRFFPRKKSGQKITFFVACYATYTSLCGLVCWSVGLSPFWFFLHFRVKLGLFVIHKGHASTRHTSISSCKQVIMEARHHTSMPYLKTTSVFFLCTDQKVCNKGINWLIVWLIDFCFIY